MEHRASTLASLFSPAHGPTTITPLESAREEEEDVDFDLVCQGLNNLLSQIFNGDVGMQVEIPNERPIKLGDKVRIGELFCEALHRAKCPISISPHQISLCDWQGLLPVAKSLAKRAGEKQLQKELARELEQDLLVKPPSSSSSAADAMVDAGKMAELEALVLAQERELQTKTQLLRSMDLQEKQQGDEEFQVILTLMQELDALKQEEKDFKLACRAERDRLQGRVADPNPGLDLNTLLEMQRQADLLLKKYRVEFSIQSRREALALRKEDEDITPSERKQYEQRFVELYEEIARTSDLHRKQVWIFNSNTTKLGLVKAQIQLLGSIRSAFAKSKGSAQAEQSLFSQFTSILAGYDANIARSQARLLELERERQEIEEDLAANYAKQREHYQRAAWGGDS